jgi:predicted peptidase
MLLILASCTDKLADLNPLKPISNVLSVSKPIIEVLGPSPMVLNYNSPYFEPGVRAYDSAKNDVTSEVKIKHNIKIKTAGQYNVTYTYVDENGNEAPEMTRIVIVTPNGVNYNTTNGVIVKKETTSGTYPYYEYLPKGYDQNQRINYPVLIYLHGSEATDLDSVLLHGPLKRVKNNGVAFPVIVVHPKSSGMWNGVKINEFITYLKSVYRLDEKRIFLTGIDSGAGAVWEFARSYPGSVAAIIPMATDSSLADVAAAENYRSISLWSFHSKSDSVQPLSNAISYMDNIYKSITKKTESLTTYWTADSTTTKSVAIENKLDWIIYNGINAGYSKDKILTIFPYGALDCWTDAYAQQVLWDWLWTKSLP